jgi:hypothetical protein
MTRPGKSGQAEREEEILCAAMRAEGDYGHVTVRSLRGQLYIHASDETPVARLTPLGAGNFGLSFHHHTGRWEPMPFSGNLVQMAKTVVATLGPYLQPWDQHFSHGKTPRKSGSDI